MVRCGSQNHDLFVAESDDGVDASGAAGGNEACQKSYDREQGGDASESERVGGAHVEQQCGQET